MAFFLLWHISFEGRGENSPKTFHSIVHFMCAQMKQKRPNAYDDNTHPKFNATTTLKPLYTALNAYQMENFALLGMRKRRKRDEAFI